MNTADYAVIVGLSSYHLLGTPPPHLKGPENDAKLVEEWLLDPAGGALPKDNVFGLKSSEFTYDPVSDDVQPNRDKIERLFKKLDAIAGRNEAAGKGRRVGRRLYVYMSGHGFSPERDEGCLFSADATENDASHVYASAWMKWFQDADYFTEFVLWMDSCMDRNPNIPPSPPLLTRINASAATGPSFVAFAAQRNFRAVEVPIREHPDPANPGELGHYHGAFTWELVQGLRGAAADGHGMVTGRSLADWLRNAVPARMNPRQLAMRLVSPEPDIVKEDEALFFASGLQPPRYPVTLRLPGSAAEREMRLWTGRAAAPTVSVTLPAASAAGDGVTWTDDLPPGLYVAEVPALSLRQGFEVTRAKEVTVERSGPPVSPGAAGQSFVLDPAVEVPDTVLSVVGDGFRRVARSTGPLNARLPFGVYKLRSSVNRKIAEYVVLLDRDVTQIDAPRPPSAVAAAPLPQTAATHEYHEDAARQAASPAARRIHVRHGTRAQITVMARVFDDGDGGAGPPDAPPWEGVQVVDGAGKVIADLGADGDRDASARDPFAVCTLSVDPGSYFLRQQLRGGRLLEQSLILPTSDWRLEAYTLRRLRDEAEGQGMRGATEPLPQISLQMRRLDDGHWGSPLDALNERACGALADERRILNGELEDLLLRKFLDPLAGIIGAHLLIIDHDRERRTSLDLLDEVVTNLRRLIGPDHPDVEALALRCPSEHLRPTKPIRALPMFERSWRLMAAAMDQRPDLVPMALWERAQAPLPVPPFLTWAADEKARAVYRRSLAQVLWAPPLQVSRATPPGAAGAAAAMIAPPGALQAPAAPTLAPPVAIETARGRAARLRVPAPALEALREEYKEALAATSAPPDATPPPAAPPPAAAAG